MTQRSSNTVRNLEELLHRMTNRIRQSLELPEILEATVDEMRRFLKTDRVKIYQFHTDGSGEVVAEAIYRQHLPSLLAQRFPAEDIPEQARELFLKLGQRSIVNVSTQEIGLSPLLSADFKAALLKEKSTRLSFRKVDPCHVEYLTAMGVQSSLVVPILHRHRLWGLLVAHHSVPKRFGNRELEIVQLIADQVTVAISHANLLQLTRLQGQHEAIINQTVSYLHSTIEDPLQRALDHIISALRCSGGRLYTTASSDQKLDSPTPQNSAQIGSNQIVKDRWVLAGRQPVRAKIAAAKASVSSALVDRDIENLELETPESKTLKLETLASKTAELTHCQLEPQKTNTIAIEEIEHLSEWEMWLQNDLSNQIVANLWAISDTNAAHIPSPIAEAFARADIRSVLIAKLVHQNQFLGYLSLFRQSIDVETVWAGRLDASDPRQRRPRQSFEAWHEIRHNQALAWEPREIGLMQDLIDRFSSTIYQNQLYQKVQALNAALEQRVSQRTAELQETNRHLTQEIVERERALAALQEARDSLTRLSHQNELILKSAGEGIYGIDPKGNVVFSNPAAAKILGHPNSALVGKFVHDLLKHAKPEGDRYQWQQSPIFNTIKHGQTHHVTGDLFERQDGTQFPVEYVSTSIRENGQIIGAVVIFQDITERQAMESMKDEFIAVVSHELRTPLTSIRAALGLLAQKQIEIPAAKQQRMIEIASSNTNRLVRLVSDILDVERIKLGKVVLNKQTCNLSTIMAQAADEMRAMADNRSIHLLVSPLSVQLYVDPDKIIQTIANLLSNAIRFSPAHSSVKISAQKVCKGDVSALSQSLSKKGKAAIASGSEISDYILLIKVEDEGRGIPKDKLEAVFEQFEQLNNSHKGHQGGTGLGLAICRSIVRQHQGEIWAQSEMGIGSTFFFTLPIASDTTSS
ncbi:ATP-binding protein [cf. Phormidesmis sp. LEGE 11477]|uniref:ATP-binding protein n=1 Tax=cf. Phormidesmis sp. LEGE 11477 TaxID=1828680 RepID=UPI00187FC2AE|nr:ATP-binding protein [cf. Phormidesmis sp. LEGE 11477]MBE9061592.1 GAF domain-containing protein [cf. Phormidesmis sp. LEGE 11477]